MNENAIKQRRITRLFAVLASHNMPTLADVALAMDRNADYESIRGVGPVLAGVLKGLMKAYYEGEV